MSQEAVCRIQQAGERQEAEEKPRGWRGRPAPVLMAAWNSGPSSRVNEARQSLGRGSTGMVGSVNVSS